MSIQRKRVIERETIDILENYNFETFTEVETIAGRNLISFHYDFYTTKDGFDAFDGLLIYDKGNYHIHINLTKSNDPKSPRNRFSFAHELGHFFIQSHRHEFRGSLKPSNINFISKDELEIEANYFASCLLMPKVKFTQIESKGNFGLPTLQKIASFFQTSLVSTILRYTEIGLHPIFVGFYKQSKLLSYKRHEYFSIPYRSFRTKVGEKTNPYTAIGEYYVKGNKRNDEVQRVKTQEWFDDDSLPDEINELVISGNFGVDLSILWFD